MGDNERLDGIMRALADAQSNAHANDYTAGTAKEIADYVFRQIDTLCNSICSARQFIYDRTNEGLSEAEILDIIERY